MEAQSHSAQADYGVLVRRFSWLSLAWIVLFTSIAGFGISYFVLRTVIETEIRHQSRSIAEYLSGHLAAKTFGDPKAPDDAELLSVADYLYQFTHTTHIKLRAPDGRVVWSDIAELSAEREHTTPEFQEALAGKIGAHYEFSGNGGQGRASRPGYWFFPWVYEVYVPVTDGLGDVVGVAEIYQLPWQVLNVIAGRLAIIWAILFVSATIYLLLSTRLFSKLSGELLALQHDLEKGKRLAMVGQSVGMIMHDTRNLLGSIRFACARLAAALPANEKHGHLFRGIDQPLSLSFAMMNDLLDFASGKKTVLHCKEHQAGELLEDVRPMLDWICEPSSHRLNYEVPEHLTIYCDGDKLVHIVVNLVRNSANAMTKPGEITIEMAAAKDGVRLQVRDTGTGFEPELLATAFEPFVSGLRAPRPGLGLAIVRHLVERHGGHVHARNRPQGGAEVTLFFPGPESAQSSEVQKERESDSVGGKPP